MLDDYKAKFDGINREFISLKSHQKTNIGEVIVHTLKRNISLSLSKQINQQP